MNRRALELATAALLLAMAALWLLSALASIANYSFRYPALDQYRVYHQYLALDFPASVLQVENGHRPVLPASVRVAEIRWLQANHALQRVLGTGLALLTMLAVAATAWRSRRSAQAGAAAVLATVIAVFWLANARMLMHGNELMHTYLVTCASVFALLAVPAARGSRPVSWMAVAGVLATVATFTFGSGIACFAAVFVLAATRRVPLRAFAVPAMLFVFALSVYLVQLPGDDGVRNSIAIQPLGSLHALTQWLASPWFHAWLGFASPGFLSWNPGDSLVEQGLGGSAHFLASLIGSQWEQAAGTAIGGAGLLAYGALVVDALRRRGELNAQQSLALGLATFALAVGSIVCLARLPAFQAMPMQAMADRYLPWTCLFWLGLLLGWSGRPVVQATGWRGFMLPVLTVALAVCLYPSHVGWAGWSATVHRIVQQSAVAAQLGIWDAERFPRHEDAPRADVERSLALLQAQRMSMFAEPAYDLLVEGWRAPDVAAFAPAVSHAGVTRRFHDDKGAREVAAIDGWVSRIEARPRDPVLAVVDAGGAIRGLAKFSFVGPDKAAMRFNVPAKRGFDGYVLEPRPGEVFRVLVLDPQTREVLAQVPLTPAS